MSELKEETKWWDSVSEKVSRYLIQVLKSTLIYLNQKYPGENRGDGLPDLCPTDDAEFIGEYEKHLDDLLSNRRGRVLNIAITAPYSGGKSSFINTFIRTHPEYKYTQISLATFKEQKNRLGQDEDSGNEFDDEDSTSKIEKSIVQQLLYRTKSEEAANSRFRRIYPKKLGRLKLYEYTAPIAIWLSFALLAYFFDYFSFKELIEAQWFEIDPSIGFYWFLCFMAAVPILAARDAYSLLHNMNITHLNPFKGEVAFEQKNRDSIFNIYLEEIIYYFSHSKSDVVFFEDLDRFEREKNEIFTKLKELNKLINDSEDVEQNVRFIYALKDDVFQGSVRTKFFDAIIPIIPIANRSNSYPKLRKLMQDACLIDGVKDEFLRDVSVFLDDMRLLKNIVTEFGIYANTLRNCLDNLDLTNLLSFIIYKNYYCDDFALLHQNKGVLADFINSLERQRVELEDCLRKKIKNLEAKIRESKSEHLQYVEELNLLYLNHYLDREEYKDIRTIEGKALRSIPKDEVFSQLLKLDHRPTLHLARGANPTARNEFSAFIEEFGYTRRKEAIQNKSKEFDAESRRTISSLREQISLVRYRSYQELIGDSQNVLKGKEPLDLSLLTHLLRMGYIDENYHLYISVFAEGHMTLNDMEYISSVKLGAAIDPSHRIDNFEETIKHFNDKDFLEKAFFNHEIIDGCLSKERVGPLKANLSKCIGNYDDTLDILVRSFSRVRNLSAWMNLVLEVWPKILAELATSSYPDEVIIGNFVKFFRFIGSNFEMLDASKSQIREYLSRQSGINDFLPEGVHEIEPYMDILQYLDVAFDPLENIQNQAFLFEVLKRRMVIVNRLNLASIVRQVAGESYSLDLDLSKLIRLKTGNLDDFLEDEIEEICKLISNHHISVSEDRDYVRLLNHSDVDTSIKYNIISQCVFEIESIATIENVALWRKLFDESRITVSWENIFALLENEGWEQAFARFLCADEVRKKLLSEIPELEGDNILVLKEVLLHEEIGKSVFKEYIGRLNIFYLLEEYQELSRPKLEAVIEAGLYECNIETYKSIQQVDEILACKVIEANPVDFVNDQLAGNLSLTENGLEYLAGSKGISDDQFKCLFELSGVNGQFVDIQDDDQILRRFMPSQGKYAEQRSIPQISGEGLLRLVESLRRKENKVLIVVGQLQYASRENIIQALISVDPIFENLSEDVFEIQVDHRRYFVLLAEGLDYFSYIDSYILEQKGRFNKQKIIKMIKKDKEDRVSDV